MRRWDPSSPRRRSFSAHDVLDPETPWSRPFHSLPDGTLLATTAAAGRAVLTSEHAVPAFDGARRPRAWYRPVAATRLGSGFFDLETGRAVLLEELERSFGRAVPAAVDTAVLVDTLELIRRPIALSTVAALLPDAGAELRADIVDAAIRWLAGLATLIIAARPPRRLAASTRLEKRLRAEVDRLLSRAGPDRPPALAIAGGIQVPTAAGAWLLDLLSRDPDTVGRIRTREPGACTGAVWETLRLYPPTWGLPRLIIADTTLAGTRLPVASRVFVSPLHLGRDPELYPAAHGRGPGFAPERWRDGSRPGDWLPFGAGPHSCPGRSLALAQLQILAEFSADRLVTHPVSAETRIDASNGLLPDPHRLRCTRRQADVPSAAG